MLVKIEPQEIGIDAEYWDLNEMWLQYNPKKCIVQVRLYKNKSAKQDGKKYIKEQRFELPKEVFTNQQYKDIKQAVRQAIKANVEFFSDAEEEVE